MQHNEMPVDHPDFGQIAAVIASADDVAEKYIEKATAGLYDPLAELHEMHAGLVSPEALFVAARLRAAAILHDIPPLQFISDPLAAVSAIWSDGFLTGIRFQQGGGHTA
jgi:hypothetical protein